MRIGIVEIGEPLPLEQDVRLHRSLNFAKYLASQGNEVHFWTSNFSHANKVFVTQKDHEDIWQGVNMHYLKGLGYKANISMRRFLHEYHFGKKLYKRLQDEFAYDIFYLPVPTISSSYYAAKFCQETKTPYIVDIVDRWPEAIFNLFPKILRSIVKLTLHSLTRKMRYITRNSSAIWGCSDSYMNYGFSFLKAKDKKPNFIFYLGYEKLSYDGHLLKNAHLILSQKGINRKDINIFFVGTIGKFFEFETVIIAARKIQDMNPRIKFIIAGDGSSLQDIKKLAHGLSNVIFLGWINAPMIQACMELSTIGLAPYSEKELFAMPNKPFEYMSAGLPILSSIQNELPSILEKYSCGYTYKYNDHTSLISGLMHLIDSEKLDSARNGALRVFNTKFSHSVIHKKAESELLKYVKKNNR